MIQMQTPASSLGEEDTSTWDEDMIYGCVCDSSWEVGLQAGQTQEPEWFGPDCSLRHCPSGDDPSTPEDETDCYNVTARTTYKGASVRCMTWLDVTKSTLLY